jgi:hypothetical protein
MYTADALASEVRRGTSRSAFHSISISGRDPLSNVEYICAAFDKLSSTIPVMLDCDGQRPAEIDELKRFVTLTQVTLDGPTLEAQSDRAFESLRVAAKAGMQQALVMIVDERTTDAHVLRVVERAHAASESTVIVVHPGPMIPVDRDRRWMTLFERAAALHGDIRLALRLPPPTGMR